MGLDSHEDSANYIHIDDVKDNTEYYCPCCREIIKPRAYRKDVDYQVQPHFYHETGGCNEETFVHYICKTWLFEKGCKFIVNNVEYEVDDVAAEKTLHTSFGDYRPDIIVTTVSGKIFYFEIRVTNKKTEHYIPRWDELGNDVVEVDTRYFINQKYKNDIPEFNLIYSGGECYIKSFSRNDYDNTIAKRKLEWKRQDKLNYKIQWERLDWFWIKLQKFKSGKSDKETTLVTFDRMDYTDKVWCYNNIKNKSCNSLKEDLRENINSYFFKMLDDLSHKYDNIKIRYDHISPLIYKVTCIYETTYLDYNLHESSEISIKLLPGKILSIDSQKDIEKKIRDLSNRLEFISLNKIYDYLKLPYVKSITPMSHWSSEYYNISELYFKIEYEDYIHSKYIKEPIGIIDSMSLSSLSEESIKKNYLRLKKQSLNNLDNELINYALKKDFSFLTVLSNLNNICTNEKGVNFRIRVSKGYNTIALLDDMHLVYEHRINSNVIFGEFEEELEIIFKSKIQKYITQQKRIERYVIRINLCKNKLWSASYDGIYTRINLHDGDKILCSCHIKIYDYYDEKVMLHDAMLDLLEESEEYYGIRYLREN